VVPFRTLRLIAPVPAEATPRDVGAGHVGACAVVRGEIAIENLAAVLVPCRGSVQRDAELGIELDAPARVAVARHGGEGVPSAFRETDVAVMFPVTQKSSRKSSVFLLRPVKVNVPARFAAKAQKTATLDVLPWSRSSSCR